MGSGPEALGLIAHPDHTPQAIRRVSAALIGLDDHWLQLRWRIEGGAELVVPPFAGRRRADGLWQTTCFEMFVAGGAEGYCEFNFSPSEAWAAYDFTGYRAGMCEREVARPPVGGLRGAGDLRLFDVAIPRAALPPFPWRVGLSAVLEEEGGAKSYWALAHPPGKADFHDPACFALRIGAPEPA